MRRILVFGSLFLLSVFTGSIASPCECSTDRGPIIVTDEPPVIQTPPEKPPAGPRTEINTNVSRNSSKVNTSSDTKASQKVKTKERKDGTIVTVIVDKTRTKNKTDAINDSYDQANRTVIEGGTEDSTSLTKEREQELKEVSVAKNVTRTKIVTDKNGKVLSDTVKSKTSEKDRKSEKTKESETLIHTVKKVTTEPPPDLCITVPPTPPCDTTPTTTTTTTTTTTERPRPPCGCRRTTTTTKAPPVPTPCDTTTTTTTTEAPPVPTPCDTTTTRYD